MARSGRIRLSFLTALCLAALLCSSAGLAAQDETIHTLHVYTNLIQLPVLVLDAQHLPIAPVASGRFSISLDSGPAFPPTHVRLEGDDPITLAVLLDGRGSQRELMSSMGDTLVGMVQRSLHARDHLAIYTLDCKLFRTMAETPADQGMTKQSMRELLHRAEEDRLKQNGARGCAHPLGFVDALMLTTNELSRLPGRRVMLAVSDGSEAKSTHTWKEATVFAEAEGVAIFGLAARLNQFGRPVGFSQGAEAEFQTASELSGGMLMSASSLELPERLDRFVAMLRGRYILEFPRAKNETAGKHGIVVRIAKSNAFIRASGIAIPLPDPKIANDPTTVPGDTSHAPEFGDRRILGAPR